MIELYVQVAFMPSKLHIIWTETRVGEGFDSSKLLFFNDSNRYIISFFQLLVVSLCLTLFIPQDEEVTIRKRKEKSDLRELRRVYRQYKDMSSMVQENILWKLGEKIKTPYCSSTLWYILMEYAFLLILVSEKS